MSETVNRFGYEAIPVPLVPGDPDENAMKIDLGEDGGIVILPMSAYQNCVRDSDSAGSFLQNVLDAKAAGHTDWAALRDPDSELGRNMESGTPPASRE